MSRINISEKVDVLFIGNLQHSDQCASFSQSRKKQEPHTDQIHFHQPVKVHLFRIVKPRRDIYKKYHSITQTQKSIRNFEIFYRNVTDSEGSGTNPNNLFTYPNTNTSTNTGSGSARFSLFSKNGEENLLANLNDDILITSKQGIYTDILVVRGFFTKITVCVYGYILTQEEIKEKCMTWSLRARVKENTNDNVRKIQPYYPEERFQEVREFQEKRELKEEAEIQKQEHQNQEPQNEGEKEASVVMEVEPKQEEREEKQQENQGVMELEDENMIDKQKEKELQMEVQKEIQVGAGIEGDKQVEKELQREEEKGATKEKERQIEKEVVLDTAQENVKEIVKSELLQSIQESVRQGNVHLNLDYVETWYDIHDDQINDNQIRNFTSICQKLQLSHFALSEQKTAGNLVALRNCLEEFYADLSKIFRNKHLGMYYSTPFRLNQFITFIPSSLPIILLECLSKSQSQQFRALEILRLLLQLESMMRIFVSQNGVQVLQRLYFKYVCTEAFSLIKVLVLQVFLVLAQYPSVAKKFVQNMVQDERIYEMLEKKKEKEKDKEKDKQKQKQVEAPKEIAKQQSAKKQRSKERSRSSKYRSSKYRSQSKLKSKKKKRNRDDSDEEDRKKKKKRDKSSRSKKRDKNDKKKRSRSRSADDQKQRRQKQKERERQKERQRQREKQKEKERQRQKQREKEKERERQKEQTRLLLLRLQSQQQIAGPYTPTKLFTFYQLMISQMKRDTLYKQAMLTKMLIQQILHSVKKTKDLSEQVAIYSPLLRQTRHLFNPSRELVNNKTLKTFSTYQPYLNALQSEGLQNSGLDYIAEVVKVMNPIINGLDVKAHKIVNIINGKIINNQYDEEFILAMSELIMTEKSPILGINRMIHILKSPEIKQSEAVLIMLYEYIYKSLVEDDGFLTLLHIEQVSNAITSNSHQIQNYSRDMRMIIKFLWNYAIIFDQCFNKQFILKALADTFLKTFQYVNIQLTRFLDYQSISSQPLFEQLKDIYNLGNFNQLLPDQPLLSIDVMLKVFVVLCKYSKNIWTSYYQLKLTNGFAILIDKLTKILEFFLSKNIQQEYASSQLQQKPKTIDNYLSVLSKLLSLTLEKSKFEASFNELPEQDVFDEVQVFNNAIKLFDLCLSAYKDKEIKINSDEKIKTILNYIVEIFFYFFESVELTRNKGKQKKLKKILDEIYIKHFNGLQYRPQMLVLFGCLIQCSRERTKEMTVNYFLQKYESSSELAKNAEILLPNNQKSVIQNLFKFNVYRSQHYLRNSLVFLFRTFLDCNNYHTTCFIYKLIELYVKQTIDQIKLSSRKQAEQEINVILLNKLILLLSFVESILIPSFKNVFVQFGLTHHVNKLFRIVIDELTIKSNSSNNKIILLKLRNTIMKFLVKIFNPNFSMSKQSTTMGFDIPNIEEHQNTFKMVNLALKLPNLNEDSQTVTTLMLEGCRLALSLCIEGSKALSSQMIILYGEYIENAFKPESLVDMSIIIESKIGKYQDNLMEKKHKQIFNDIYEKCLFFLVSLTQIPSQGCYNCQKRKLALKHLIGDSVFPKLSSLPSNPYLEYLQRFFTSPSLQLKIQKQLQRPKQLSELFRQQKQIEEKPISDITFLFNNFSQSVLDTIFQKQDVAKTRYKAVVGEWIGGDVDEPYMPLKMIDTKVIMNSMFGRIDTDLDLHSPQYNLTKSNRPTVEYNELLKLYTKKQYSERVKRFGTASISFKQIPLEIKAPEEPVHMHKTHMGMNSMSGMTSMGPLSGMGSLPPAPPMPYKPQVSSNPTYVPAPPISTIPSIPTTTPVAPSTTTYQPPISYQPPVTSIPQPPQTSQPPASTYTPQTSTYTRQQQYQNQNPSRGYDSNSSYYYQPQTQQPQQGQHQNPQHHSSYSSYNSHHQNYSHGPNSYQNPHPSSHQNTHQYGYGSSSSYPSHSQYPPQYSSHSSNRSSTHHSYPSSSYQPYPTQQYGQPQPPQRSQHQQYHPQEPTFQTVSELVQKLTRARDAQQKARYSQELEQILTQYPHLKTELSKRLNEIKEK